ncbi:hypothetical protein RJT34_32357 [Clitoria ternatea]|uniref:Uncharacterized protein n=1 Tax=Clitoria ternatea TaxID=43366 RepID=A0AAN9EW93_CLITE
MHSSVFNLQKSSATQKKSIAISLSSTYFLIFTQSRLRTLVNQEFNRRKLREILCSLSKIKDTDKISQENCNGSSFLQKKLLG